MQITEHAPLAPLTTMRVGGSAARLVTAQTGEELVDVIRTADAAGEPLFVLGGGSNVVLPDEGLPGTVVRVRTTGIHVESADRCSGVTVRVAAGENWDEFVAHAVANGWTGIEALSGIPGSVGATPVQNVGAYGQDVAQTIARVRTLDRHTGEIVSFANAECEFGYRDSMFKRVSRDGRGRYVVLDVVFQLELGDRSAPVAYADLAAGLGVEVGARVPLPAAREAVLEQRRRRGMVLDVDDHDTWSCGSFFTNPVLAPVDLDRLTTRVAKRLGSEVAAPVYPSGGDAVKTSAAWLIERAGFAKGFGMPGPVALSTKHTLAITNRGDATSAQILAFAEVIRAGVFEAFGIELVPEPNIVR